VVALKGTTFIVLLVCALWLPDADSLVDTAALLLLLLLLLPWLAVLA